MLQITFGLHDLEHAFAHHHQFCGFACGGLRDVDDEVLERLMRCAIDFFEQHLRLADLQFVAFAAHGLDEDAQVQDATSVDVPFVFAVRGFDAQGEVLLEFSVEALADVAAGEEVSVLAEERRC